MRVYEIFQNLDETLAHEIIGYFRTESRDIYKATVSSLAQQRKLRAAYVQKKPGADQIAWVVTLNVVATAIATPATGWIVAKWGQRNVLIWAIVGFSIS